jgi:hypothetical protein
MGWIRCARCEKFQRGLVARTCALIVPVQPVLPRLLYSNKMVMSLGSNGVNWVRSLRKILMRLRCTNLCIMAPVWPVCTDVHAVTKWSKTLQNMSLGSNGVDRVRVLPKIPMWLRAVAKRFETPQNMSFGSNRVDRVRLLRKLQHDFMARICALIALVWPVLYQSSCSNITFRSAPNTWVWGQMWWIGCVRCKKFRRDFVAWTCALIAPIQPILHGSSCSNETVRDAPKYEFGVQ